MCKATYSLNAEKNGVEIHFGEKPSSEVLASVKAAGFRWSAAASLWYAKQKPDTMAFAASIAGEVEASEVPSLNSPVKKLRAYSMNYMHSGYKSPDGTYTSASYHFNGSDSSRSPFAIELWTDSYGSVPMPAGAEFSNDSDSQSDYFCHSMLSLPLDSPDWIGAFEGMKKAKEHDQKLSERRDIKSYGHVRTPAEQRESEIRAYTRTCESREAAEKLVDSFIASRQAKEATEHALIEKAVRLAQELQSARDSGVQCAIDSALSKIRKACAELETEVKNRRAQEFRANCLSVVKSAKADGRCQVVEGVAFIVDANTVLPLFTSSSRIPQKVYNLLAIDEETGNRLFTGELNSLDEVETKKAEIVRDKGKLTEQQS